MILACLLTVAIETPLMYLFGYRSKDHIIVVICANCATNLILNSLLAIVRPESTVLLWLLEAAVVISEWLIYKDVFGPSRGLLAKVFLCNLVTALTGFLLFY